MGATQKFDLGRKAKVRTFAPPAHQLFNSIIPKVVSKYHLGSFVVQTLIILFVEMLKFLGSALVCVCVCVCVCFFLSFPEEIVLFVFFCW
jgi:hypothetical protein